MRTLGEMFGAPKPKTAAAPKPQSSKAAPQVDASELPTPSLSITSPIKLPEPIQSLVTWPLSQPVPFKFIASMMNEIEAQTGRNAIIEILSKHVCAIACTTPDDLVPFCFMCSGDLRPAHENVKLDVGDAIVVDAIAEATGRTRSRIKQERDQGIDLGDLAMSSRTQQGRLDTMFGRKQEVLTIRSVYQALLDIANVQGSKTQRIKVGKIVKLLTSSRDEEAKFIIRSLVGRLRIGCAQSSLLVAIGCGFRLRESFLRRLKTPPDDDDQMSYGKRFKKMFLKCPVLDDLIVKMLQSTFDDIEQNVDLVVGVPVMPMLAKPSRSLDEIQRRIGDDEITCEYKYDGERAQIHKRPNGTVTVYSRSAKDSTAQFHDIIPLVLEHVRGDSWVIDSEIVAYDVVNETILPFQTLMHRSRKGTEKESPIQICIFAFDLLHLDGNSLLSKPLVERRTALHDILTPVEHKLKAAVFLDTDLENLAGFFKEAVANRTEGLMIKGRTSVCECGKRSQHWAKLKKNYVKLGAAQAKSTIPDTLDVCPVGVTIGRGKRAGLYASYLVAVYNTHVGRFQAICDVGTGFSEQVLDEFTKLFKDKIISKPPSDVQYGKLTPQFYIQPCVVWEIEAADILRSPVAACCFGEVEDNNGLSLRFARFKRIREDKEPFQCTSAEQILELYFAQPNIESR
jgi:DNA ligase-1